LDLSELDQPVRASDLTELSILARPFAVFPFSDRMNNNRIKNKSLPGPGAHTVRRPGRSERL
jgi:hypothetical protein